MKYSYHVHSTYSDGESSIKEIIQNAKKIGLDEIGISDHFCLTKDGSTIPSNMQKENFDNYISEVLNYSSSIKPKVKLGLEAEFVQETLDEFKQMVTKYPFDYLIGSCHMIDAFDDSVENLPQNYSSVIMRNYWKVIKQMASTKTFDIVGHLDRTKKLGIKPSIDLSKEINEALIAIKDADMTVELNTSGWHQPCKEQYPSVDLLKKCKKLDIPIIVTSDAHRIEHLTRDFDKAFRLLKEIGYSKQAYFDKRKRFFTDL